MKHISGSETHVGMDFVMRYLFNNKTYWPILEGLLYCVLNRKVKIKHVSSGETNKEHRALKLARIDITIETVDDLIIVMELQKEKQTYFLQRVVFGVSRTLIDHLKSGENYELLKRVLSVNILYFPLFKGMTDYVYDLKAKLVGRNDGSEFDVSVDGLIGQGEENQKVTPAYHFILVKQMESDDRTFLNHLQQWIYFFRYSRVLSYFDAPGLQEAGKRFIKLNLSLEEQQMLTQHEMDLASLRDTVETGNRDLAESLKVARRKIEAERRKTEEANRKTEAERRKTEEANRQAEARHNIIVNLAKEMLLSGRSVDEVHVLTNLSREALNKIQATLE